MTQKREDKFREVIRQRQANLTVILENVHDPHNIGAVLRSCDSVGIKEIYVLYSVPELNREHLDLGKRTSSGARKWVDVHFFTDTKACFEVVKSKYQKVWSTHLAENSVDLYEMDLTGSIALLFGNEKDGLTEEALKYSDGNFIIPQMGMVQSLNISVACAVTLYETLRQRKNGGFYDEKTTLNERKQNQLFEKYEQRHIQKYDPETTQDVQEFIKNGKLVKKKKKKNRN